MCRDGGGTGRRHTIHRPASHDASTTNLLVPGTDDQWPSVKPEDLDNVQRLTEVQEGLGKLNYYPPRGTILDDPKYV